MTNEDTKKIFFPAEAVEYMHCVYEILDHAATHYKNDTAYIQKGLDGGEESITFCELKARVNALRAGLFVNHFAGQHVAVIGETSIEWITVYLALISGVGVCVPIDKELADETMVTQLNYADVETVAVSAKYLDKLSEVLPKCPGIKNVVVMRGVEDEVQPFHGRIYSLEELIARGEKIGARFLLRNPAKDVNPEENCVIIFTSGTTGANKGVMLNNRSIMGTLRGCARLLHYPRTSLSVLPINHSYELNAHLMSALYCGTCVTINDDLRRLVKNLKKFQPEMSCMVPAMLDMIVRSIKKEIKKSGKEEVFQRYAKLSALLRKFHIDMRESWFQEVCKPLGGKLKCIICGGAPLSQDTIEFLDIIGIQVYNGYGITECSPVAAVNSSNMSKAGSVGRLLPTVEARIANVDENGNGEIELKGDIVMLGYYKAPEDTAKVFTEDGWFKTGDIGHVDKDHFLYLTGRLKNLIILPNGKNIYPEELEEALVKTVPYVKECVVSENSQNSGLYAYIHPDIDYFAGKCQTAEEIKGYMEKDIEAFNASRPTFKRMCDYEIVLEEFAKNTAHKILRHKVINSGKPVYF